MRNRDTRQIQHQQRPSDADDHRPDPVSDQKARQRMSQLVDRDDDQEDHQEPENFLPTPPSATCPFDSAQVTSTNPASTPSPDAIDLRLPFTKTSRTSRLVHTTNVSADSCFH